MNNQYNQYNQNQNRNNPTSLNNSISRSGASGQNNRYTGYNRSADDNKGKKSVWAVLILPLIFLVSVLDDIGVAFILIPIIFTGVIVFIAIFAARAGKKNAQNTASRYGASAPVYNTPAAGKDAHLCDDGQHASEGDQFDALAEMEPGYVATRSAAAPIRTAVTPASYSNKTRRLSPEEYAKKRDELRDLRDSGIISQEEYAYKLEEYRR